MGRKIVEPDLLSFCWLYCKACNQYRNGDCPGCRHLKKSPKWCTIRNCCIKHGFTNCSECKKFIENGGCEKFESMVVGCLKFLDKSERSLINKTIKKKGFSGYIHDRVKQDLTGKTSPIKK